MSEDGTYEWEELTHQKDGKDFLISSISTANDSPEDNMLSRIGGHKLGKLIQIVKNNPDITFEEKYHEDVWGYMEE